MSVVDRSPTRLTAGRGTAALAPPCTVSVNISDCRGNVRGEKRQIFYKCTQKCILSAAPRGTKQEFREHTWKGAISQCSRIFVLRWAIYSEIERKRINRPRDSACVTVIWYFISIVLLFQHRENYKHVSEMTSPFFVSNFWHYCTFRSIMTSLFFVYMQCLFQIPMWTYGESYTRNLS